MNFLLPHFMILFFCMLAHWNDWLDDMNNMFYSQKCLFSTLKKPKLSFSNDFNDGFVLFMCPIMLWQWASMYNTRILTLKQLNDTQPSFLLLFTADFLTVTCQTFFCEEILIAWMKRIWLEINCHHISESVIDFWRFLV